MGIQESQADLSRRTFIKYAAILSAAAGSPALFTACAIDPVTGKKQLNLVSRQQEIGIDRQQAPHQFSADYGVVQDKGLNRYVSQVGQKLLPHVHRPDMPYTVNCVNANYVNAYAFPGGTIGISRGILLELENEAELASLIGHELGHVNARHSAEQMSKGQLSSLLIGGLTVAAGSQGSGLADLTQQLGALGQGLLLSKYSRDNEREADGLGNEYMVKAGYPSKGFVGLMEMLDSLHKQRPNSTQILFSTHPMSSERLDSAAQRNRGIYKDSNRQGLKREQYMDQIASLRAKRKGIELLQTGEKHMAKKEYDKGQHAFQKAVKMMPEDYTARVLLAKTYLIRKKPEQAVKQASRAKQLYKTEAQGWYLSGFANAGLKRYSQAYKDYSQCEKLLPGNPQVTFFKGYCLDKNGDRDPAAKNYIRYLKMTGYQPNTYSKYAYAKLKEWGYAK